MSSQLTTRSILIVLFIFVLYLGALLRGLTERSRRSLELHDETSAADRVLVSAIITNVNPAAQEMTAQLGFRPIGGLSQDSVTPSADLKLLVNNVSGQQEFDFAKGKRMNRIEAVFPLNGDVTRYPLDHYETTVWLLKTTPATKQQPARPAPPESALHLTPHDELAVSADALRKNTPVPLSISLTASTPGIKFVGQVSRSSGQEVTGIELDVRRADNVIAVSLIVMLMMTCLSMGSLAMALRVLAPATKFDLLPLSFCVSLLFGLPALRNIQPGAPPVGALSDYVTFIWAELAVGASAIIIIWAWLARRREASSP
jgi:hypothetical protein